MSFACPIRSQETEERSPWDVERQVVQRANGANLRVSFSMQDKTQWARLRRRVSNSIRVCVFGASARGKTGVNELQQARVFFAVRRHHFE